MPSMRNFYACCIEYNSFIHLENYTQDGDLPSISYSTHNHTLGTVIDQLMGRMNRRMVSTENNVAKNFERENKHLIPNIIGR